MQPDTPAPVRMTMPGTGQHAVAEAHTADLVELRPSATPRMLRRAWSMTGA